MPPEQKGPPARKPETLLTSEKRKENLLKGVFWVVCPTDGVQQALRVRQWGREESAVMAEAATSDWFIDGLYTSGECSRCGMTLKVSKIKPHIKKP